MERLSSLPLSFDRVLIQILIPGLIGALPWLFILMDVFPSFHAFLFSCDRLMLVLVGVLFGVTTGLFLENAGAMIEVHVHDCRLKGKYKDFDDCWRQFLQLSYEHEPVGHRYLRNLLMRMKFELSMGCALVSLSIGVMLYDLSHVIMGDIIERKIIFHSGLWLGAIYLIFFESYKSANLLATTRKLLVEKYYTPPSTGRASVADPAQNL